MGWDVLKVINLGDASGAAFQTGMRGNIFDQFAVQPDAAPIPEASEIFFSSTYRHFLNPHPTFIKIERGPAAQARPSDRSELSDYLDGCQFVTERVQDVQWFDKLTMSGFSNFRSSCLI